MRVAVVTIGTRGDVQPYVALALGLKRAGYDVRLFTSRDFQAFVEGYGLPFHGMNMDAREIFSSELLRNALSSRDAFGATLKVLGMFRAMLAGLFDDMVAAADWADVIVYSPVAVAAAHVAAWRGKRTCGAFIQPWTATASAPQPNFSKFGGRPPGWANRLTSWGVDALAWYVIRPVVNDWRERLGLAGRPLLPGAWYLASPRQPVLNGFSPLVVPKPADWGPLVHTTGYWFLDRPPGWEPPAGLVKFLSEGPPPVYVGFGSWPVPDATTLTRLVIEALGGQRAVLYPGWSGTGSADLPDSVCVAEGVPHDWLFPRVAAVVHHGGAGTTAAALRAGVPTVIVAFDGDHYFWGRHVERLKAGPRLVSYWRMTAPKLSAAIRRAATDPVLRERAAKVGEQIRSEDGVTAAVTAFGREFGR